ncbi:MAG: NAD(P)/FAD-dependent oxidoreductase [Roseibium sp.]|uniref:NAD(P)/FAD-dependent oxidoreductase n=1 Tax=Roseibium sp. TaxID=1936156 RepID=UPI002624E962|nr:NAD(P)/FAD-dependent oxidoreductase [Roseibium sp.]MCV0426167.1 NAD(P)/FAD-dependent oxidoreductase [Roseibium sp.]
MQTQVAIVGSGPAGLAAALTLSRSMIDTVILNGDRPARNASSPFVAALPGMDRRPPADIRADVRRDILSYPSTRFVDENVVDIRIGQQGFDLVLENGSSLNAEILLLATGMQDILPQVAGLEEVWGTSVINCPFCHGYEWKDRKWGIYAHRPEVIDAAEIYRNWTSDLVYFLDPDLALTEDRHRDLAAMGIAIERMLPNAVLSENGTLARAKLPDGRSVPLDCMLIYPYQKQADLLSGINVTMSENGYVEVDEGFRTNLPNIYAAGDLTYGGHQNTPTAFHMGNMAAATIVMDLCFKK